MQLKVSSHPVVAALFATMTTHMLVVLASLVLPVVAPLAAESLDLPARYVGLYATFVFLGGFVTSLMAPGLIARFGAVRVGQGAALSAGLGLVALLGGNAASVALSALLVGFGYGPANTASSWLLSRFTPEGRRSGVFSIKQASVPFGSALAGLLAPPLAILHGWQGAAVGLGLLCVAAALAVQPWRAGFDDDRDARVSVLPRRPLAPLAFVLGHPRLRALGLMGLVYAGAQFTFGAVLVTFLVERAGLGPVEAGAILSAALGVSVVARVFWGYVSHFVSPAAVLGGLGALTVAFFLAALFVTPAWPPAALIGLGVGFGATGYSWNGVFLGRAADEAGAEVSTATAGVMSLVFLGSLATPALFTWLIVAYDYEAGLLALSALVLGAAAYAAVALRPAGTGRTT